MTNPTLTLADIESAAERISGVANRTPVVTSRTLDSLVGAELFLKCENLQRVGAFKFRGAYNAMSQLSDEERASGVVAVSSGNHAQAVALAARLLGVQATIVMPQDAPAAKLAATRGYGAEVITFDRYTEDRDAIGAALVAERGSAFIPPYNHPRVMAGAGTAALELVDEVGPLDVVIVPVSGGGLISGSSVAVRGRHPETLVWGAEPAAADDAQRSLEVGARVSLEAVPQTIADGAQSLELGDLTWPIIQREVAAIHTATDAELIAAVRFAAERLKLWIEPTGALALAVAMNETIGTQLRGKRVGVLISGGNMDAARFAEYVTA